MLAKSARKRLEDVDDDVEFAGEGDRHDMIGARHCSSIVPGRIRRNAALLNAVHGCNVVKWEKPVADDD